MESELAGRPARRAGFLSFRITGTDGVSLETKKWAEVFEANGFECYYLAGELDTPGDRSMVVPELHFTHHAIRELYEAAFSGNHARPRELTAGLHEYRKRIKDRIYDFVRTFAIDLLVPENVLTIPLNLPFGMALTELIAETNIRTIAHHHDFFWERKRFLTNCVWDILNASYPPHLKSIVHVVINTSAQNQLALRTGISSTLIPNVMNFEQEPPGKDGYNSDVRQALGVDDDELLVLQPTRVVQRKGIEHAIELVARLGRKAALVISHASGDEGYEYQRRVKDYAALLGIKALFHDSKIGEHRSRGPDGSKIYSLEDVYPYADLVTYPSLIEGFGNAFLEAVYFRKPIVVNNYSIYSHDIKPKGFDVIEIDDFVSARTIDYTRELLDDPQRISRMVEKNYSLARTYFSYSVLGNSLGYAVRTLFGEEPEGEPRRGSRDFVPTQMW